MHLYETHIPVADTGASEAFYREVVGLPFAYRDPTRDIVFMWVDEKEKAMLGLWGPNTRYGPQQGALRTCHFAFAVSFDQFVISYFLAPPGVTTLPVEIYGAIRKGFTPEINAISTIIIVVSMGVLLLTARFYRFGGER